MAMGPQAMGVGLLSSRFGRALQEHSSGALVVSLAGLFSPRSAREDNAIVMCGDFDGPGIRGYSRFELPAAQVLDPEITRIDAHGRALGIEEGDDPIALPATFESQDARVRSDGPGAVFAATEGRMFFPEADPIAEISPLFPIDRDRIGSPLVSGG